ncbi:MAG: hypothetical protein EOM87_03200 [Clostridia bacterium]|nr:hypothetical protein [Clostridia bacterium]
MKKITIIVLALSVLFAAGIYFNSFIAVSADYTQNKDNSVDINDTVKDENETGKEIIKKDTFSLSDFYTALEKAEQQYASNDNVCSKLSITPNDAIISEKFDVVTQMDYYQYLCDIEAIILDNLTSELSADLIAAYDDTLPETYRNLRNTTIDDGSVFIFTSMNDTGYKSASEMLLGIFLKGDSFKNYEFLEFTGDGSIYNRTNSGKNGMIYPTAEQKELLASLKDPTEEEINEMETGLR